MARYAAGITNSGINTANTAYADLVQLRTVSRLLVRQVTVTIGVAPSTAPIFYLSRPTGRAATHTTTQAGLAFDDVGDTVTPAGTVDVSVSGDQPTGFSTTLWMQKTALAVTVGGAIVWSFWDTPLIVAATAGRGLAVVNLNASGSTTGTFQISYVWDE